MLSNRRDTTGLTAGTVTNNSSDENNHKEDREMSDISSHSTLEAPRPRNVRGYSSFQKID